MRRAMVLAVQPMKSHCRMIKNEKTKNPAWRYKNIDDAEKRNCTTLCKIKVRIIDGELSDNIILLNPPDGKLKAFDTK
jgi:hypothetical protein